MIDASKPEGERPGDKIAGEVALRDVDFAYPTRPDVPVFRGFTLVAPAGQMTALVGESGSGKSTIVNLVERFYDVDKGAVLLDGVNVKSLDITWLRAKVCACIAPTRPAFNAFCGRRVGRVIRYLNSILGFGI